MTRFTDEELNNLIACDREDQEKLLTEISDLDAEIKAAQRELDRRKRIADKLEQINQLLYDMQGDLITGDLIDIINSNTGEVLVKNLHYTLDNNNYWGDGKWAFTEFTYRPGC